MKPEQQLKAVIEKGENNGWIKLKEYPNISAENLAIDICAHIGQERKLLLSHNFAKAYWGEDYGNCDKCGAGNINDCSCVDAGTIERWQYHLQQAVLEEDILQYLDIGYVLGGRLLTEETIQKMRGPKSEEHKKHIGEAQVGKTYIELYGEERAKEISENISEALTGKKQSKEHIEKRIKALTGLKI